MHTKTLSELSRMLDSGETSSEEMTRAHVEAMENARPLNAFITETPDAALDMARRSDERRKRGEAGVMEGLPVGIKDMFCTRGIHTTAGSRILSNFVPPYESTVTHNLFDQGAVMLGKLNQDEFGMGSSNQASFYGPCTSPWRGNEGAAMVPGGSSGGSAAAVAARVGVGATGTDTGGSLRLPAAYSGVVGAKPTYGRCSRFGIVAYGSSLDQAGPMTRTVRDSAIMLQGMAGHDPNDSTSANRAVPDFETGLDGDLRGLTVGIPREYQVEGMPQEIVALWTQGAEWLKSAGASVVDISLPHTEYALPAYYIIASAEASSNLARYDGVRYGYRAEGETLEDMYSNTRAEGFGTEVKRRVLLGTYPLSAGYYDAYYRKAQKVRSLIRQDFTTAFQNVDVILTPTTPSPAFRMGEKMDDPIQMYLNDVLTVPANLAGLPGVSVPAGLSGAGLPLGLQVLAPWFDEATLFKAADAVERAAEFNAKPAFLEG